MSNSRRHPFVRVFLPADQVEMIGLRLWELGATGLEQHDQTTIVRGTDPGRTTLTASFDDESKAAAAVAALGAEVDAELCFVDHQDWAVEWRRGFGPQRIGTRVLLQPSWEPARDVGDRVIITIDPENAFGSGDHETTRLVLSALDQRIRGGERVLDVGCGSGILSIAAIKLGAAFARGIDVDDDAVTVARRNATRNAVDRSCDVSTTPLEGVDERYDVVVANIETRVLVEMPEALRARCAPGGLLVLSGILREEHDAIVDAFGRARIVETLAENEWLAFVLLGEGE
ncbi:MAG: 50S ribosomal protein L11 methyltransferase [Polyangiales bacterium]